MTRKKRQQLQEKLELVCGITMAHDVIAIIAPIKVRSLKKLRKILLANVAYTTQQMEDGNIPHWEIDPIPADKVRDRFRLTFETNAEWPPDSNLWYYKSCIAFDGRLALIMGDSDDDLGIVKYKDLY